MELTPSFSQVLTLLRTYTCDAGSSPTSTTARPGVTPCSAFIAATWSLPGLAVLPLPALVHPLQEPLSLDAMSAGIVLLALLPSARVLLALWLYARQRNLVNVLAALVVFLEFIWSIQAGA